MTRPRVNVVVAMARNGVIGRDGGLPWHLPADLQHFKQITLGSPIIMGRLTHESIGRVLPGRLNIVVSATEGYRADGCVVSRSFEAALAAAAPAAEVMVIGGAALYRAALPCAHRIYLTEINADVTGNVFFPAFERGDWREVSRELRTRDARHAFDFSFVVLERCVPAE